MELPQSTYTRSLTSVPAPESDDAFFLAELYCAKEHRENVKEIHRHVEIMNYHRAKILSLVDKNMEFGQMLDYVREKRTEKVPRTRKPGGKSGKRDREEVLLPEEIEEDAQMTAAPPKYNPNWGGLSPVPVPKE